jgi:hypothetical protein
MIAATPAIGTTHRERRSQLRFPLVLELEYTLEQPDSKRVKTGTGVTVNLSGGGALFKLGEPLPLGRRIQLSLRWPVMLDGRVRLTLLARGRTVRVEGNYAAVQFSHYEFRVRPTKPAVRAS